MRNPAVEELNSGHTARDDADAKFDRVHTFIPALASAHPPRGSYSYLQGSPPARSDREARRIDLAAWCPRHAVAEHKHPRNFVSRQPRATVRTQRHDRWTRTRDGHACRQLLASSIVSDADHGGIEDAGKAAQCRGHFVGLDLSSGNVDERRQPSAQGQMSA